MSALSHAAAPAQSGGTPRIVPAPGSRRGRRPLGDPTPLACTVAKAALEAILGGAPFDAYVRWVDPAVYASICRERSIARRAGRRGTTAVGVRRARTCRVARDAAEVSIVLEHEGRCRAAAMRLEESHGRWLVTELALG